MQLLIKTGPTKFSFSDQIQAFFRVHSYSFRASFILYTSFT